MTNNFFRICCISALFSLFSAGNTFAQNPSVIIPAPAEVQLAEGTYKFSGALDIKVIRSAKDVKPEGYIMKISKKNITLKVADDAGLFYARQSLAQMTKDGKLEELQCCLINDYPRFNYRGVHFDVSRHFRSIDFLKKQIDAMAYFKMNKMHIHLTDAAGWRMQIEKYPRLSGFAAWRAERLWKDWCSGGSKYVEEGTPGAYGGYYTKEELKDLVAYAAERHIDIIPEIEMPGHSEEVTAAYPEVSCTGKPYSGGDLCVGKEKTFELMEGILDEVIEVFPYEYVHVGGDEAGKANWKTCPDCQKRMKDENLANVDELQSYMIHRIEKYLNSKGRKLIGWDEILEGGVSKTATVMSWRGTEGGIKAMKSGNDVIMTPGRYCYLDHTQDAPFKEPESIGGYLPLELVYSYEPVEETMPEDGMDHLIGVQANLWTEYVTEDSHAEYMYWPRAIAIAEIGWSRAETKDYDNFKSRVIPALETMNAKGYTTFNLLEEYGERKCKATGIQHKAVGAKVSYTQPYSKAYPGEGDGTLTDGKAGGWTYSDGRWLGFISDMDVTIDLGKVEPVHYIGGTFMQLIGPEVFMPEKVEILISSDGENYTLLDVNYNEVPDNVSDLIFRKFDTVCNTEARFIRYKATRNKNKKGWLFIDEIVVN